jgi:hypothetical protein
MVKRIAYVMEDVANPRNRGRFGIDFFLSQGIAVDVIEVSGLTFPEVPRDRSCYGEALPFRLEVVKDAAEWERASARLAEADFVVSLVSSGWLDPRSIRIYRAIARAGRPYMVLSSNAFPGWTGASEARAPWLERLGDCLRSLRDVRPLHSLVSRIPPAALGIPHAAWIVYGGAKSVGFNRFVGPGTRAIWAHAMDYDTVLAERARQPADTATAVFLDEYHPFHPDQAGMGISPPTPPAIYYGRLRDLFDRVEAELGLKVVVAACPRAHYDDKPGLFGDRPVLMNATARLVAESRLVLAHRSTAISFAILFGKPVLQVAHRTSYVHSLQKPFFDSFAAILGKPIRFIDDPAAIDLSGALDYDRGRYDGYMRDYVKQPTSPDLPYWRIVLDAVAKGPTLAFTA